MGPPPARLPLATHGGRIGVPRGSERSAPPVPFRSTRAHTFSPGSPAGGLAPPPVARKGRAWVGQGGDTGTLLHEKFLVFFYIPSRPCHFEAEIKSRADTGGRLVKLGGN